MAFGGRTGTDGPPGTHSPRSAHREQFFKNFRYKYATSLDDGVFVWKGSGRFPVVDRKSVFAPPLSAYQSAVTYAVEGALSDATRRLLADKTRSTRAARVFPSCVATHFYPQLVDTHRRREFFIRRTVRALPRAPGGHRFVGAGAVVYARLATRTDM